MFFHLYEDLASNTCTHASPHSIAIRNCGRNAQDESKSSGVTFQRRWYRKAVQSRTSLAHLQRTKLLKLGDKAIDILDLATTLSWRGFYRTLAQSHEQNSRTTKSTYQ
jgi:hypothetical protein